MINIPLPFYAMWFIMFCGVVTNVLAKVNAINHKSPANIMWYDILKKFISKEWAAYGVSIIFTGIIAFSFEFMKKFDKVDAQEISRWAKYLPLSVLVLYFIGVLSQWIFYIVLGRIQSKGQVDIDILKDKPADS